ncbi:MAG: nitroreductase family protein [Candidatus Omnitrophota bacterium]
MRTFIELARSRRSIRAYTTRPVKRELLESCAEAARHAPSACNSQPWKFIIIDDDAVKNKMAESVFSGFHKMCSFAREASAFIVIVAEKMALPAWIGGKLRNTDFKRIDTGIACSHIVLAAKDLGIDSCILGWFNERKLKKILHVPPSRKIELVIALGYPASDNIPERPLKDKSLTVSFNGYK